MKNLPIEILIEKNRIANSSPFLIFLDIVLTDGTVFHLINNNENLIRGGNEYIAFPFMVEFPDESSKGELTFATLKVSNVTRIFHTYLEDISGGVGSTVTITPVHASYLDSDYTEIQWTFDIIQMTADVQWMTFKLGFKNLMLIQYPTYRYIANHCNWIFNSPSVRASGNNKGRECNYQGDLTTCNRTWDDCQARSNTHRYGGHKGLQNTQLIY